MKGTLLAQGIAKSGLYKLLSCEDSVLSSNISTLNPSSMMLVLPSSTSVSTNKECLGSVAFNKESVKSVNSTNLLHNRLGHPSKHVIQII